MTPQRSILIALLASFAAFVLLSLFGIVPLMKGIAQDAKALQGQKQALRAFEEEGEELASFGAFSKERSAELNSVPALFVSPETPIPFIEFLEEFSLPLGMELAIAPGTVQQSQGDAWPALEFRISSKTSYPRAYAFLKAVEHAPFALRITNLTMEAEQQSVSGSLARPALGDVVLSFTVKAYTK